MTVPEQIKSCCAASYGTDAVALLLGESHHPGGQALTRRLVDRLRLRGGSRVLDVASGPGATARIMAAEHDDVTVDGADLSSSTVERARATAAAAGLARRIRFQVGDAERIPLPDNTFDVLV